MSSAVVAVLAVMMARTPWVDRAVSREERAAALTPVAIAMVEAAHSREELAALVELGRDEGENFALVIVRGGCTSSGCDHGLSRGVFQLRENTCPAAFALPAGSAEAHRAEALCAIETFRYHAHRCSGRARSPFEGGFSGYATGRSCRWSGAEARVRKMQRIIAELARAEKEAA